MSHLRKAWPGGNLVRYDHLTNHACPYCVGSKTPTTRIVTFTGVTICPCSGGYLNTITIPSPVILYNAAAAFPCDWLNQSSYEGSPLGQARLRYFSDPDDCPDGTPFSDNTVDYEISLERYADTWWLGVSCFNIAGNIAWFADVIEAGAADCEDELNFTNSLVLADCGQEDSWWANGPWPGGGAERRAGGYGGTATVT